MVTPGNSERDGDTPAASPAERIHAARFVLLAAAALLFVASFLWAAPVAFPIVGTLLLALIAGFVPRRRAALIGEPSGSGA